MDSKHTCEALTRLPLPVLTAHREKLTRMGPGAMLLMHLSPVTPRQLHRLLETPVHSGQVSLYMYKLAFKHTLHAFRVWHTAR